MIASKEVKQRVDFMVNIGVSDLDCNYFEESATDIKNDDIICLVDDLSSKVFALCVASNQHETKEAVVAHLRARQKLIEKIKGIRRCAVYCAPSKEQGEVPERC